MKIKDLNLDDTVHDKSWVKSIDDKNWENSKPAEPVEQQSPAEKAAADVKNSFDQLK